MSKFLSFWLSVILVIFFIVPTSAYASNSFGSYTYYITVANHGWRGQFSGTKNLATSQFNMKPVFDAISSQAPAGTAQTQVIFQSIFAYIYALSYTNSSGQQVIYPSPRNIPPADTYQLVGTGTDNHLLTLKPDDFPITLTYPDPMFPMEYDVMTASAYFNFDASSNLPFYGDTVTVQYRYDVVITTSFPLDLSGVEGVISSGLLTISNDLHSIQTTIQNFYQAFIDQTSDIKKHLLDIINAINNSAGSGGGTAAIVGAINSATGQINKVLAQQQVSSDSIVGAIGSQTTSINAALGLVQSAVSGVTEELKHQAQANLDSVQSDGNKVTGMASDLLEQVNDKWSALTVPIDFTKKIFEVFTNGTRSASYRRIYGHIAGYRYDSSTGGLEPIYTANERAIGGTVITLPAFDFNLPGVGALHVWDSYDFDLGQLKTDFPIIFDAIYVISGILMIYWIVEFIINLGNELLDI